MTQQQVILEMFKDEVPTIDGYSTTGWKIHSFEDGILDIRCYAKGRVYIPTDVIPIPETIKEKVINASAYEDDEIWTRIIWKVDLQ